VDKIKTVLIGLGTVNIGFLKIIINKKKELEDKHDIEFVIVGVSENSAGPGKQQTGLYFFLSEAF